MAMETHTNQIGKDDNRALWTLVILIVAGIFGYAAYEVYNDGARDRGTVTTTEGLSRNNP